MDWNDKKQVLEMVKKDPENFLKASEELRGDKEFVLSVLPLIERVYCTGMVESLSEELRDDKDVIMGFAKAWDACVLRAASQRLRDDKDVVLAAIEKDGDLIEDASDRLKDDEEVAMAAVQKHSIAYLYISARLKNNRDIFITAVQNCRLKVACEYEGFNDISDELKDDKEAMLIAVQRFGFLLELASDRLKDDKDIVLAAVKEGGTYLLEYASKRLQEDADVLEAVKKAEANNH